MENPPFADAFPIGKGAFPLPVYQFQKPQEVRLDPCIYIYSAQERWGVVKNKQIQVLESNIVGSEGVLHE